MKFLLILISVTGLGLTVVPSMFVMAGRMPWPVHAQLMFAGMILWFVTAPFWMNKKQDD